MKSDGCNKIRCTKCGTLQCDVCRQTITDYSHFNDIKRGGRAGQCPLFDQNEERYEKEVSNAEVEMRKKVVEENPDVVSALPKALQHFLRYYLAPIMTSLRLPNRTTC